MSKQPPDPSVGKAPKAAGKKAAHHERAARVLSITGAVVIKDEDLFFLSDGDGAVPLGATHGFGLYYHDCRFLNGYELRIGGERPNPLLASARRGFQADLVLTNPDLALADGGTLPKEAAGIQWRRVLDTSRPALVDQLAFHNYTTRPISFPVTLSFAAAFEDIFQVRGMPAHGRGQLHQPAWQAGVLHFAYDGSDGLTRSLMVHFDPAPVRTDGTTAHFDLRLRPREDAQVRVALVLAEVPRAGDAKAGPEPSFDFAQVSRRLQHAHDRTRGEQTEVRTGDPMTNRVIARSLGDLRTLRGTLDGQAFYAAGVPWYVTLFGRDSLTAALQTLAYDPDAAAQTLRLLARYQGTKSDDWRDEQPGKIMHELRVGELARTDQIPQTPYYGSIDATPLFLVLVGQHAAWTGERTLFEELRDPIEKALAWIARDGDPMGAGYLAYECKSKGGLGNQGWKDSGDSIMNADGSLAEPPIALAEVQGYVYRAKKGLADLYRRAGDAGRGAQLGREADELRERFNRDFWLEDRGIYALALQAGGRPAAVVASNAGQVLWSGIAEPDKARRTAERLLADDVFDGWGIRTLSSREVRYNPVGYHLGTVWPHDNSLIVAGLRDYGQDEAACRVFAGIVEAATYFRFSRLPEVFAGFGRDEFGQPVHYPVACHPQAWAAGAVPYMLQTLLGLVPEAFEKRLRVVRPVLPPALSSVEVRRLCVGRARADLRFERGADGKLAVKVLRVDGPLDVAVVPN